MLSERPMMWCIHHAYLLIFSSTGMMSCSDALRPPCYRKKKSQTVVLIQNRSHCSKLNLDWPSTKFGDTGAELWHMDHIVLLNEVLQWQSFVMEDFRAYLAFFRLTKAVTVLCSGRLQSISRIFQANKSTNSIWHWLLPDFYDFILSTFFLHIFCDVFVNKYILFFYPMKVYQQVVYF